MFLHIKSVAYLQDYKLRLEFNNGVIKEVDLADVLHGQVFEPLRDLAIFRRVKVNADTETIEWSNGADFAPEFLYEIGETVSAQEKIAA